MPLILNTHSKEMIHKCVDKAKDAKEAQEKGSGGMWGGWFEVTKEKPYLDLDPGFYYVNTKTKMMTSMFLMASMSKLTEKNLGEWLYRIRLMERLDGHNMHEKGTKNKTGKGIPIPVSWLTDLIGMTANITEMSRTKWNNNRLAKERKFSDAELRKHLKEEHNGNATNAD